MPTPSTMIIRALQMIGEKAIGGTLTSDEQTAYLSVLNAMMESWSLERLMCYQIVEDSKALVAGTASYTIGSGATWNTTRPNKIVGAFVRDSSNYDTQIEIVPEDVWRTIGLKSSGNTYPEYLYYDTAYAANFGTIYLWPKPQASLTLYIESWKQLQTFVLISTTVALPPGYQRAIESNLAIELAPGFASVSQEVVDIARESKAAIKGINLPDVRMRLDDGVTGNARSHILLGP